MNRLGALALKRMDSLEYGSLMMSRASCRRDGWANRQEDDEEDKSWRGKAEGIYSRR